MIGVTEGIREAEFAAENFRELTLRLKQRWPDLAELIEQSAVAIDGQIYQGAFAAAGAANRSIFHAEN